jgi:hypothetical protein
MTRLRGILPLSASDMPSTALDDVLKYDVRDVLMFFSAAESLGFTSIFNSTLDSDIGGIKDHFISVGNRVSLSLNKAFASHQLSVDLNSEHDADKFTDENALDMKTCFIYMKSFENLLSPCGGYFVDDVKKSIQEATSASTAELLRFLTMLNNYTVDATALSACGHSALAVLTVDLQLCDSLSVLDEYLPSAVGSLKFIAIAYQLKSGISKVISSTRNKIPMGDFDGVLSDLKKVNKENPMVATEMRGIVQEVFKALSTMMARTSKSAEAFELGATSEEATLSLFNDVREISNKSMAYIVYLTNDQLDQVAKRKEFNQGVNTIMHLICSECRSRLESLDVDAGKVNYYKAEKLLAAATRAFPLLKSLASDIKASKVGHASLIPDLESNYP